MAKRGDYYRTTIPLIIYPPDKPKGQTTVCHGNVIHPINPLILLAEEA